MSKVNIQYSKCTKDYVACKETRILVQKFIIYILPQYFFKVSKGREGTIM